MKKETYLNVILTPEEKEEIRAYCKNLRMGMGTFTRTLLLRQIREEKRQDE